MSIWNKDKEMKRVLEDCERLINFDRSADFSKMYMNAYHATLNKTFTYETIIPDIKNLLTKRSVYILMILRRLNIPKHVDKVIVLKVRSERNHSIDNLNSALMYPFRIEQKYIKKLNKLKI